MQAGRRPRARAGARAGHARRTAYAERGRRSRSRCPAQLANPFLVPDFSQAAPRAQGRLAGWELIAPLLNSFEQAAPGAPACMELPEPRPTLLPPTAST